MNAPPETYLSVPHEKLHAFVSTAAQAVGLPEDKSELLATLLTANDLRGIFSHGTEQIATYALLMRDGALNNNPQVEAVRETATSLLMDGDGGLGYFPAYEGTKRVVEKARDQGMAVVATRNHGHFGGAGLYARMTLDHDLITFVTSGVQLKLKPEDPLYNAGGGSPMSFSAPTCEEEALVLDFGTMRDLYGGSRRDELARIAPGLVLRCIGLGEICQVWGGLLAGLPIDGGDPTWRTFSGANQGALVASFRIDLFHDTGEFKAKMDDYVRQVRQLRPLEGFDQSFMPGGVEAFREQQYREEGVPVGTEHQKRLERLAEELGIALPW